MPQIGTFEKNLIFGVKFFREKTKNKQTCKLEFLSQLGSLNFQLGIFNFQVGSLKFQLGSFEKTSPEIKFQLGSLTFQVGIFSSSNFTSRNVSLFHFS
jgi:hypothetical protein